MKLGDNYRLMGDIPGAYGPPDPPPGSCEECGGLTRHDPACPNRGKRHDG